MMIHECPNTRAASGQCHVRVALLASLLVLSHWTFGAWYTKGWSRDVLSSQPWTFQAWSLCFRLSSTWETRPFAGAGTLGAVWHHNRSDTTGAGTLCAAWRMENPVKLICCRVCIHPLVEGCNHHQLIQSWLKAFGEPLKFLARLWLHGYLPVDASGDFVFQVLLKAASNMWFSW